MISSIFANNMDIVLDLALRIEKSPSITDSCTSNERREYKKRDCSNCMSLIIIKHEIPKVFRGDIFEEITSTKDFHVEIEKHFMKSDKTKKSLLLQNLISMKYQDKGYVREYIMEMWNIHSKLKVLKLELLEDLLIQLVLII